MSQSLTGKLWGFAIVLALTLVGAACGGVGSPTPTSAGLISEQQAIDTALRSASFSRPEVSGALVTPMAVQAEQLMLAEAATRVDSGADFGTAYKLEMPVWLVTMEGLWMPDGLALSVTPVVTETYHHFAIILDAVTGQEIFSSLQP